MPAAVATPPDSTRMCVPHTAKQKQLPPVILLGGNDNALSLARGFGKRGIDVYILNKPNADVGRSRYVRVIPLDPRLSFEEAAVEWLCGRESESLWQSVLLAASDEGLTILAEHRDVLAGRFLLDMSNPAAQRCMLDKLATYWAARKAGVSTPNFWQIRSRSQVDELEQELTYPVIVKPLLSHVFQQKFSTKFFTAQNRSQLDQALLMTEAAGVEVLLVELIPGPDSTLCSYYTWLDEEGHAAFDFTKRIIRRYPMNMGLATYHITDHVPGVKEQALKLFRAVGLQGLANAEFKFDARDGLLKLIECNARFTAANCLVTRAGLDLGALVYNRLVGLPPPPLASFRDGLTLWDPLRDWKAYCELSRHGELTFFGWLSSVFRQHSFPSFTWSDPLPAISRLVRQVRKPQS